MKSCCVVVAPALLGTTLLDAADAAPVPALLIAATVKVYAVPLLRPVTTMGEAVPDTVTLPGADTTT